MVNLMRAVVAKGYGPPSVLSVEEVPVPHAGPGQLRVRVRSTALNPADLRSLSGVMRDLAPLTFPHVPGSDFAGTVTAVGAGVTRFAVGDEVFGVGMPRSTVAMASIMADPPSLTTGAMAEYAVFEADTPAIALRPPELPAEHAATLPIPGLTALAVLRAGNFVPGQRVLVLGAAGGVGGAMVPLLARQHVIATAIPEDEQYVRSLGAAEVINYRAVDTIAETLRRYPDGVDAVVNLAAPGPGLTKAVRPGGQVFNAAFPSPNDPAVLTVFSNARPGDLDHLAAQAIAGALPSTVSRRFSLDDAPLAYHELVDTHVRGKFVVNQ